VAAIADELPGSVTRKPIRSVLLLGDFTGAQFSREAVEHIKDCGSVRSSPLETLGVGAD
jgi:hypothetical protein